MRSDYIQLAQTGFLILTLVCMVLVLVGIRKTLLKMGKPAAKANQKTMVIAGIMLGWLALVSLLSLSGILSDFSTFPPKIPLVILPPLVTSLILTFHPKFRNFLAHVPPQWLLYLQMFRVPVEIFLWWLFLANALPVQMSFEGRNWDVLTGLTAPLFAWLCFGNGRRNNTLALLWNVFGFALLLNIVATAILSLPTPIRVFLNEPDSSFVTTFPIVFLPSVLVPLAYTLHFFSVRQLWFQRKNFKAASNT